MDEPVQPARAVVHPVGRLLWQSDAWQHRSQQSRYGAVDFAAANSLRHFCLDDVAGISVFQSLLRLNKFGRLVLSREQTVATNWFGICLLLALVGLGCALRGFDAPWLIMAVVFGLLLLPVSAVFKCHRGSPRYTMTALTVLLVLLGSGSFVAPFVSGRSSDVSGVLLGLFVLGTIASTWIANILVTRRPKF